MAGSANFFWITLANSHEVDTARISPRVRSKTRRLAAIVDGARWRMSFARPNAFWGHSLRRIGGKVVAVVDRVGDVAGEMGQAGLLRIGVTLLSRIAIRTPDIRPMSVHHVAHHDGAARRGSGVNNRTIRAKDPVICVAVFDADTGLVRADDPRLAEFRYGVIAATRELLLRPAQHVHQTALADRQAE